MLGRGDFFFLNVVVDHSWDAAAVKATGRLMLGFAFGIAHESFIKRFFGADVVVVIKSQLAALTTL